MRHVPVFLLLLLACAGCNLVGASVGAGADSGMAVVFSSYNDFLYTGPGEAYSNNRKGLNEFLAGNYADARKTFTATLDEYPGNPDAVYYLGLTLIHQGERAEGFAMLQKYNDPFKFRITQEVRWWGDYCSKKPDLAPEKIRQVLNKARGEGYRRDIEDDWTRRGWL
ncbi:MAG: tetratricopeptide repeat protein [Pseudodesulfovibrio sp.]